MSAEDISAYDIPFNDIETRIVSWVAEALELRHGEAGDPEGRITAVSSEEGPQAVQHMLIRVRARSDRVDGLLAKVTQAKGRTKRAQDAAAFEAERAYDTASVTNAANRTREFTSARERTAEANLDSFEQKRHAYLANRLVSVASEAYDLVHQIHWQLDGIRKDLRATLHSLQFESSLER